MNKMYLGIIGFLLVLALLVGGYAVYKTANQGTYPSTTPNYTPPTGVSKTPTGTPTTTMAKEIALTVTSPKDGEIVSLAALAVKGQTVPNADVSVNDKDLTADASGNFSTTITLDEGDNGINIIASDQNGNSSEQELTVTYEPAQ